MRAQGLTKMRIPSASFCQLLTIWLSSSSAALEYMEKNGPELSPKLGSFDGRFGANRVWLPSIFLYASVDLERTGQSSTVHTWVVPSLKIPASILRHLRDIVLCYEDLGLTALTTKRAPGDHPMRANTCFGVTSRVSPSRGYWIGGATLTIRLGTLSL